MDRDASAYCLGPYEIVSRVTVEGAVPPQMGPYHRSRSLSEKPG